ncbi:DUF2785 domain-containing protein [Paucibacter sp. APW11]|uniref:DUF2785 domain-containing protein n=1 Tax=Roseateles aquae TaxID=3077235 RepID=A0ABU3PIH7_9BURK|nr:DUF2785 domain-containing protein [Paucibacter sp. APW11]MDT9002359.1 DUF2785 domain-containing protein [Paucibacter sp. APW11]
MQQGFRRWGVMAGLLAGLGLLLAGAVRAECPPAGMVAQSAPPRGQLQALDAQAREALQPAALALLDCLADPRPELRDEFAFETLSAWLRAGLLTPATQLALRTALLRSLAEPADAGGFRQPFAALSLAELARADRLAPVQDAAQREALLDAATRYLAGVNDRRGFTPAEGWRHGVAHGADLLYQLSMNPALTPAQQRQILRALQSQVLGGGTEFYRYGEGQRLAAPALHALLRSELDAQAWADWLDQTLAPLRSPAALDEPRLLLMHNAREFLWPLYVALAEQPDVERRNTLIAPVRRWLKQLR